MENIEQILKEIGIEIPEDKKEAFNKKLHENYKTISEVNGIQSSLTKAQTERDTYKSKYDEDIAQRDADLAELKKKLEQAGADENTITQLTQQLNDLQENYTTAKDTYEKKLAKQSYEFAVKEKTNELKFSSNSAKKAFISDLLNNPLNVKDGQLLGFNDFVEAYKKQDADAFILDSKETSAQSQTENEPPMFSTKTQKVDTNNVENQSQVKKNPVIW